MFVFGVILEIIGLLGMGINYPIYRKLLAMGRMIWLMIKINSDFTYLGYIIYLSALYTFYTIGMLIGNLVKYKKLSSPILSATKVLNFVSSMVSLLDLQMAMITRFSANGQDYRKLMYTLTGIFVYGAVVFIAIYMIIMASIHRKRVVTGE